MQETININDIMDYMENLKHEELTKRLDSVSKLGIIA